MSDVNGMRGMLSRIRFDLIHATRDRGVVLWVMIFPILLSTVFMFMFYGYESGDISSIPVGVVSDGSTEAAAFEDVLDSLSEGEGSVFDVTVYNSEQEAAAAADAGETCAYVVVAAGAEPQMVVPARDAGGVDQSIVQLVLDRYLQVRSTLAAVAENDPAALAEPGAAESLASALLGDEATTERLSVLRAQSSEFTRYYYAVLGFSSLMGAQVALLLVTSKRADGSPVGARCQLGAVGPVSQLASALVASWAVVFTCLVVALVYVRLVAGVTLGGREGLAVAACAVCALASCSIGTVIGAVPRVSTGAKDVALTILTMGLSLPAGLFGTPSQQLADWLDAHVPIAQLVNPAVQVGEAFYRLTFYDSLLPFGATIAVLVAISAILFGIAAVFMRRQRYAAL